MIAMLQKRSAQLLLYQTGNDEWVTTFRQCFDKLSMTPRKPDSHRMRRNCSVLNRTLNGVLRQAQDKLQQTFNRSDAAGIIKKIIRFKFLFVLAGLLAVNTTIAQDTDKKDKDKKEEKKEKDKEKSSNRILYGTASFYSNKFQGRKTANGEIFDQKKMTAACNVLPLGTWIRVTNLRNKRSVVVKTNDRLHTKMKRIVDLSRVAATQLGYIGSGLTRVKVEVLGKKKPAQ
jgi:rare lipoprotein A